MISRSNAARTFGGKIANIMLLIVFAFFWGGAGGVQLRYFLNEVNELQSVLPEGQVRLSVVSTHTFS